MKLRNCLCIVYGLLFGLMLIQPGELTAQPSLVNSAALEFDNKFYESALQKAEEAISKPNLLKSKHMAKAWWVKAKAYMELGQMAKKDEAVAAQYPDAYVKAYEAFSNSAEHDDRGNYGIDNNETRQYKGILAQEMLNTANTELNAGKCDLAMERLDQSDALFSELNFKLHNISFLQGFAYLCRKTHEDSIKAIAAFEKALQIYETNLKNPELNENYRERLAKDESIPLIYTQLIILQARAQNDITRAQEYVAIAKEKYPNNEKIQEAEFVLLQDPALMDQALDVFKTKLEQNPDDAVTLLRYATLMEQKARVDEESNASQQEVQASRDKAMELYHRVLELDPDNSLANYNLGAMYVNQAVIYQKMRNDLPTDASAEQFEKYSKLQKESLKKAVPFLEKYHEIDPDHYGTVKSLFEISVNLSDMEKMKEYKQKKEAMETSQ